MTWIFRTLSVVVVLLATQPMYAASGNFFDVIATGTNVTITSLMANPYTNAGVEITSPNHRIHPESDCILKNSTACTFSIDGGGSREISLIGTTGPVKATICLNASGPFTCQTYDVNVRQTAYISDYNNQAILSCPVKSDGTLERCTTMTTTGSAIAEPYQIALNRAKTRAYVASRADSQVFQCSIDSNGNFTNCADSGNTGVAFDGPSGIVLNQANTRAYVTNQGGGVSTGVSVCPINSDGSFGACVASGNTGVSFDSPNGIGLDAAERFAYVANASNDTVSVCPILTDGTFGACADSGNSGIAFFEPVGVLVASPTLAYITNYGTNQVLRCPITPGTGLFGACEDSGNTGDPFFGPGGGIVLSTAEAGIYVANEDGFTVSLCPLNGDGSFGSCAIASTGVVDTPIWMTLN